MQAQGVTAPDDFLTWLLPASTDLRALHRLDPERYPFLLQSTASSSDLGRYDILFAHPGDSIVLKARGKVCADNATLCGEFLTSLDEAWERERIPSMASALPFSGGWFLYLGYELAAEIEPGLKLARDPMLPAAVAVRCPAAIIRDLVTGECVLVAESIESSRHEIVMADIARSSRQRSIRHHNGAAFRGLAEEEPSAFLAAVTAAKNHIADGDIYQANLSRCWSGELPAGVDSVSLYESLCRSNPGPFAGLVRWKDTSIVSSSPERLLSVRNGIASTRPIAGTRPRSNDKNIDDSLLSELISHPKERAEHIMLIDLERNDLGRVCTPGTVHVSEMMVLESYAHVHHIVSNVQGELRRNVSPGECIRAVFPGGTITGCPKVRCMEIIAELERGPRGAYTGSFGYLNRDGSLDLNILIRTMVTHDGSVTLRAGSGIVADSNPEAELAETRAKAEGLIRAFTQ